MFVYWLLGAVERQRREKASQWVLACVCACGRTAATAAAHAEFRGGLGHQALALAIGRSPGGEQSTAADLAGGEPTAGKGRERPPA